MRRATGSILAVLTILALVWLRNTVLRMKSPMIDPVSAFSTADEARRLLNDKQWTTAIEKLKASLRQSYHRAVELDLIWALEQAGRDEEAAQYIRTHPRLWRGRDLTAAEQRQGQAPLLRANPYDQEDEPDSVTEDERCAMIATADRLVARAAFETSLHATRCEVCHHRCPPLSGAAVTSALWPDRELLNEALNLYTLACGFSKGAEAARLNTLVGRTHLKLGRILPVQHRESSAHNEQARKLLGAAALAE